MFRVAGLLLLLCWGSAQAELSPRAEVVRIGAEVIFLEDFAELLAASVRQKFYHGRPPEGGLASYAKEILEQEVDQYLLAQEAVRRQVEVDDEQIRLALEKFAGARGGEVAALALQAQRARLVRESLVAGLSARMQQELVPSLEQQRRYYQDHPEKFTAPPQQDVSVIVLGVEPSAGQSAWDQALLSAQEILVELGSGASFEELAELHSSDASSSMGGRMGIVHQGMLGDQAQKVLDLLEEGAVSEPQALLNGVVLLKLNRRIEEGVKGFDAVKERLVGLLRAEKLDLTWQALKFRLRASTEITYDQEFSDYLSSL